jgi:hypothetical protein
MKKVFFALAIVGTLISAQTFAQGVLGKLKDKVKSSDGGGGSSSGGGDAATTTVTDEWGISGSYTLSSAWPISGKKHKSVVLEFVREENDVIVNRLELTFSKGGDKNKFKLDEKLMNKSKIKLFKGGVYSPNYTEFEIMQLDNGIMFLKESTGKGYLVMAKNADDLKTWDEETGLAKYEAEMKKVNGEETAGLRKKLEEKYPAYKANVGKIVFARNQNSFQSVYGKDVAGEDVSNFITEWITGNGLSMRGYFDKAFSETCGSCDKKINFVFEMGKHKVDWLQLRSSGAAFSKLFVPTVGSNEYMTDGTWLWDGMDYNRALVMAIHKNITDGSLKDGGKMNLKVTAYAYKDKTNGAKIAEGSISIKYNAASEDWAKRYGWFKEDVE